MKDSQRGGIASFVVVALVLTGLLAGGLYLSKHQARVAREKGTTTQVATQNQIQSESTNPKEGTTDPTARNEQTPSTKPTPVIPTPTTPAPSAPSATTVPDTGPTEVAAVTIGLSGLTYAGALFVQTRTRSRRSSLRP